MDEVNKYLAKIDSKEKRSLLSNAKRLLFGGKQLADEFTLIDYGIGDMYTIHEQSRPSRMPPTRNQGNRAQAEGRSNYGGQLWYARMMGEDGVERDYPMCKQRLYVSTLTGDETIYIWCALKQKACPTGGSVKNGVITVRGIHNHTIAEGEREVIFHAIPCFPIPVLWTCSW